MVLQMQKKPLKRFMILAIILIPPWLKPWADKKEKRSANLFFYPKYNYLYRVMRAKLLYYSAFLLTFCMSCVQPVPPNKQTTDYMIQDFKDYTDFKAGSYWIYQNSTNTANFDSIVVVSHNQFVNSSQDEPEGPGPFEEFADTLFSAIDGKFTASGNGRNNDYHEQYINWPNDETTYFTPINGVILDEWGNMTLSNSSETLNIDGKLYSQVREFTVNPQGGYKVVSPITHIWWAKNIGVIQKIVSGTTWQLVRCKVAQ